MNKKFISVGVGIAFALLIVFLRWGSTSHKEDQTEATDTPVLKCEFTSSVSPGALLKYFERNGAVTLALDIVEGVPRDKLVFRYKIDTQETGMTDLGPRAHTPDDKLLIYERRPDGSLLAATGDMASLDPHNGQGESTSDEPHGWAIDFPYSRNAPRPIGTQSWNLTYFVTAANEVAITNVTCQ